MNSSAQAPNNASPLGAYEALIASPLENTSGNIVLDSKNSPTVIQEAPETFFGKTMRFITFTEKTGFHQRFHYSQTTRDFIERGKKKFGADVFNFAFPPHEQKKLIEQGLPLTVEKAAAVLKKANDLDLSYKAYTEGNPTVDENVAKIIVLAQAITKDCEQLENPDTHLKEGLKHFANIAIHSALLTAVFWHPALPITAHVAADIAEAGIFTRADLLEKINQARTAFSQFADITEARLAAIDMIETSADHIENETQKIGRLSSTSSPTGVNEQPSQDSQEASLTALKEALDSLNKALTLLKN